MEIFPYLLIFVFGLFAGSFLNCVIYRIEVGESFLKGRSYCPECRKEIAWFDLIPVISFLVLKGKCRHCRQKISFSYPLIELATAGVFFLVFHYARPDVISLLDVVEITYILIISFIFLLIFIYDLKHFLIPNGAVISALTVSSAWLFFGFLNNIYSSQEILFYFFSGVGASAFFLSFYLISKGKWMGFGDVKLAFVLGLFLGFPEIVIALFLAFITGAVIGLTAIVFKRKGLKSEIPFAPFLIIGTFISFFWGESLLTYYLSFF